jgi:phosphohistidine swiveling domain-containing protein
MGPADPSPAAPAAPLTLPLGSLPRDDLALAGGKAVNLGELLRAGLSVPPGFCVTTSAYSRATASADLGALIDDLATVPPPDQARQAALAAAIREHIVAAPVPDDVSAAVRQALDTLGANTPVAVRSSATSEDLPFASFAGQQDTYLNVVGPDAVLEAMRRCWASLWTERAVAYRATNGIDHPAVRLAVVVQQMVDAAVAGVLFTANPLTGRRRQAVIDASPGLGEAIVSGAVNPDHFVVDTATGAIVERRLGDKRLAVEPATAGGTRRVERADTSAVACLSDEQIRDLAALGARVEAHFGAPQDTEFVVDAAGQLWLTQTRPITTLYPLPADAPTSDETLRVYVSLNVVQGMYRPFTPMGLQAWRLISSALAGGLGQPPRDVLAGAPLLKAAGQRFFLDVTPILRTDLGRRILLQAASLGEARTGTALPNVLDDPRLAPRPTSRWRLALTVTRFLVRTRLPLLLAQTFARPERVLDTVQRLRLEIPALGNLPMGATAADRLDAAERVLLSFPRILGSIVPAFPVGLAGPPLVKRLLGDRVTDDEVQLVLHGLPHNPTTEMGLALWDLAQQVRADTASAGAVRTRSPEQLAHDYTHGTLPATLQSGLKSFLATYGHRAVAEIDLGLPRWSEDPTHILGALANYLRLTDPASAPDVQFRRAADQAEAMVADLRRRAATRGWWRAVLVRALLRRTRLLAGLREMPKFLWMLVLAQARALLLSVGEDLAKAEHIAAADDIFFLTLPEARAAVARAARTDGGQGSERSDGANLRALVHERRASYAQELRRRHVPRVLLSDGTEPGEAAGSSGGTTDGTDNNTLRGAPASAGVISGRARVVHNPVGAHLEPGEILVAPSTDPGWTPLFLTAGGLVMEMGGAMSHGAVVAREYGLPAVVGVAGATERITTGDVITVDGAAGTITLSTPSTRPGASEVRDAAQAPQ